MRNLSVILPTLDSMPLLPAHVASMLPWLDLADEIISVDSYSTDGTQAYLLEALRDHPVQFHSHPRGLYQSWNSAIQRATGRWLYISTVGDTITRELLSHLIDTAEHFQSDVVLGNPSFIDESDRPVAGLYWAANEIADTWAANGPATLSGPAALFYSAKHLYTSALLGSCASNLYRAAHLQHLPFPIDFGLSGDAAWGIRHALETRFACTNRPGSFFRIHRKSYQPCEYDTENLETRLHNLVLETCASQSESDGSALLKIPEMTTHLTTSVRLNRSLKASRKKCRCPWYFHPSLWHERAALHASRHALKMIIDQSIGCIGKSHVGLAVPSADLRTHTSIPHTQP
jgi:hypothetical protein